MKNIGSFWNHNSLVIWFMTVSSKASWTPNENGKLAVCSTAWCLYVLYTWTGLCVDWAGKSD